MTVNLLEVQRARRALEQFCAERNAAAGSAGRTLYCEQQGDGLVLAESRGCEGPDREGVSRLLVRLGYRDGKWFLFWRTRGDAWDRYPHLPEADNVQRIIEELEQAPLHVYWG